MHAVTFTSNMLLSHRHWNPELLQTSPGLASFVCLLYIVSHQVTGSSVMCYKQTTVISVRVLLVSRRSSCKLYTVTYFPVMALGHISSHQHLHYKRYLVKYSLSDGITVHVGGLRLYLAFSVQHSVCCHQRHRRATLI